MRRVWENETWRIIFKMPAILGLFVMIMLLYVYKEDTIGYCVSKGLKEEAKRSEGNYYNSAWEREKEISMVFSPQGRL